MSNDRDDAQGRQQPDPSGTWGDQHPAEQTGPVDGAHGATAAGQQPPWGQPPQGASPWGPPQQPGQPDPQYGGPAQYGQPPQYAPGHGQPAFGQPSPYGPYGQPPPYGQPSPYGPYGPPTAPGRPGTVIAAAVLGLLYGALGLLVTLLLLAFGTVADDFLDALEDSDPSLEGTLDPSAADTAQAGLIVLGLLALAWAVVMVWGSFLALRGRSRVLLLVGASIAIAATGLLLLIGGLGAATQPDSGGAGAIVLFLLLFLGTVGTLVLLVVRPSSAYFAAHRHRRALTPR